MKILIKDCGQWNDKPQALRVKEQLSKLYSAKVELLAESGGVFEIIQETKILFSKIIIGRFPTNEDLRYLELNWICEI